jgi:cytochrome c6
MKTSFIRLLLSLTVMVSVASPVLAADIENGERIFTANCAACHAGGNNVIMPEKTLKKDALEANGMNAVSAITYQVTNGKNAMPAFGGRLSDSDIEDVANYVLSQSEKGWD